MFQFNCFIEKTIFPTSNAPAIYTVRSPCNESILTRSENLKTGTYTRTHTCTHAYTHTLTHAHTHTNCGQPPCSSLGSVPSVTALSRSSGVAQPTTGCPLPRLLWPHCQEPAVQHSRLLVALHPDFCDRTVKNQRCSTADHWLPSTQTSVTALSRTSGVAQPTIGCPLPRLPMVAYFATANSTPHWSTWNTC